MNFRLGTAAAAVGVITASTFAQGPAPAPTSLTAVTRTVYSRNTELFAEWRPLIAGEATRVTAHLTRLGERFTPYTEAKVTLTLTVGSTTATATAVEPERPGVFRLNVTATKNGTGRIVIDIVAPTDAEHFVIEDVPVFATVPEALAKQVQPEAGLVSYAKERSWAADFATAPVKVFFPGAGQVITVPSTLARP